MFEKEVSMGSPSSSISRVIGDTSVISSNFQQNFTISDASGNPIKSPSLAFLLDYIDLQLARLPRKHGVDHEIIFPSRIIEKFLENKVKYDTLLITNNNSDSNNNELGERRLLESMKALWLVIDFIDQDYQTRKFNEELLKTEDRQLQNRIYEKKSELKKYLLLTSGIVAVVLIVAASVAWTLVSILSPIR